MPGHACSGDRSLLLGAYAKACVSGGTGHGDGDHAPPCMGGMGAGEGARVCAWTLLILPAGSSPGVAHTACKDRAVITAWGDTDSSPFWFPVKKMRQDPD